MTRVIVHSPLTVGDAIAIFTHVLARTR